MKIQTVRGEIQQSQLGITSCHEHLLWAVPTPYAGGDPDLGFEDPDQAVFELLYFSEAGGSAVVEMTTSEIGRSPQALKALSEKTNVHIIAASGHHKDKFSAASLQGRSVDQIAQGIIADIMVGMDGSAIKAGVIKAATSHQEATESERRVIEAVGLAHLTTKAPVSTHTEEGTFALEQIDLLTRAGVSADHLLIGHLDRNLPMDTYLKIADRGVWMGFDQIGKTKYWADEERARLIQYMFQHGHRRILLSGDTARKSSWHAFNPVVDGMAHVLKGFKKLLLDVGLSEEHLEQLLVKNPAAFFAY
jgi:predicted metal-dependent phosphotriesterase family hydrolase